MEADKARTLFVAGIEKLLLDLPWGSRSKRDWELGMLAVALESELLPRQIDALAVKLRVSQRKARALVDEVELRHGGWEAADLDKALREEVLLPYLRAHRLKASAHSGRVELHIERLLLRERFRQLVREQYGLVERGLDGTVIFVDPEVFIAVVLQLTGVDPKLLPINSLTLQLEDARSPIRMFAEEFAKSAGSKAGEKAVKWTERLLTSGLSDALDWLRSWQK